jgi:flagellar capping protein FliD
VQSQLRGLVSKGYSFSQNENNPFASGEQGGTISGIGLELKGGGRLALDKKKLEEAMAEDAFSVREFLSGRSRPTPEIEPAEGQEPDLYDEGFATAFSDGLERLVRSGDGSLANRDDAFARRLKDYDRSIDRFEARLEQREETLIARFSNLEQIISGLQGQQGFLGSLG